MPFDYRKLTDDVREAMKQGEKIASATPDSGTCNMDGVVLKLPRLPETKVTAALAEAGVSASKNKWGWHGTGYMINPPWGQADKRSKAAEAINRHLKGAGYDTSMYYQMD